MQKVTHRLANLLALVVLLIVVASPLFLILHAEHDCTGEDCLICEQVGACVQHLKTVSTAVAAVLWAVALLAFRYDQPAPAVTSRMPCTLVSLKVKLSD